MALPALSPAENRSPAEQTSTKNLAQIVGALARKINADYYSAGDRADLRRLDPEAPGGAAFWRLMVHFIEKEPAAQLDKLGGWHGYGTWAVLLAALGEGAQRHKPTHNLGEACQRGGVSEKRFIALLRASGKTLWRAVRQLAHQLDSTAQSVNFTDFARLLLFAPDSDAGLKARRRLAGQFYRAEPRNQSKDSKEESS